MIHFLMEDSAPLATTIAINPKTGMLRVHRSGDTSVGRTLESVTKGDLVSVSDNGTIIKVIKRESKPYKENLNEECLAQRDWFLQGLKDLGAGNHVVGCDCLTDGQAPQKLCIVLVEKILTSESHVLRDNDPMCGRCRGTGYSHPTCGSACSCDERPYIMKKTQPDLTESLENDPELKNPRQLWIITGKTTGALEKKVSDFIEYYEMWDLFSVAHYPDAPKAKWVAVMVKKKIELTGEL